MAQDMELEKYLKCAEEIEPGLESEEDIDGEDDLDRKSRPRAVQNYLGMQGAMNKMQID